jgi:hypothetical protein
MFRKEIFIFLNHFAKLYDRLKLLHIWQPNVVCHGGLKGDRHGPRRQGARQRSFVGSGARGAYRHGPSVGHGQVATAVGDGGCRAYIRGDDGRRPLLSLHVSCLSFL